MIGLSEGRPAYLESEEFEQVGYEMLDDGDLPEALQAVDEGLQQHPGDEDLAKLRILLLILTDRLDTAEQELRPYLDDDSAATTRLSFCLQASRGNAATAFPALCEALKQDKISADEFFCTLDDVFEKLPADLMARQLPQVAEEVFSQNALNISRIAAVLMDCRRHALAIPLLERSIDIDAYDIYSWQDLARCQFTLQQFDRCVESCEYGLAIDPQNPLLSFLAGYCLVERQEVAAAIPHLEVSRRYIESKKRREGAHLDEREEQANAQATYELLCNCYSHECQSALDRGDVPGAYGWNERALECDPENESLLTLRVTMLIELHRYNDAIGTIDQILQPEPSNKKSLLLAEAQLALQCQRPEVADRAFRQLLELQPHDDTTRQLMSAYFESIGDREAVEKLKSEK